MHGIRRSKQYSSFRTIDNYHYFLIENKEYYFDRLTHHSKVIIDFVKGICDKLVNEDDKQNFNLLLKWFSNFNDKVSSIDLDAFEKKYVDKFFK